MCVKTFKDNQFSSRTAEATLAVSSVERLGQDHRRLITASCHVVANAILFKSPKRFGKKDNGFGPAGAKGVIVMNGAVEAQSDSL
jgi:hypothetical protein